jgi:hypothetical protein
LKQPLNHRDAGALAERVDYEYMHPGANGFDHLEMIAAAGLADEATAPNPKKLEISRVQVDPGDCHSTKQWREITGLKERINSI